jgi:hypothetical protein
MLWSGCGHGTATKALRVDPRELTAASFPSLRCRYLPPEGASLPFGTLEVRVTSPCQTKPGLYAVAFAGGRTYRTQESSKSLPDSVERPLQFPLLELPPAGSIGVLVWGVCQSAEDIQGIGYCEMH